MIDRGSQDKEIGAKLRDRQDVTVQIQVDANVSGMTLAIRLLHAHDSQT